MNLNNNPTLAKVHVGGFNGLSRVAFGGNLNLKDISFDAQNQLPVHESEMIFLYISDIF